MIGRGMQPPEALSLDLERAALRAIKKTYADLNGAFFRFQLRTPVFELGQGTSRLGRWLGEARVIELCRELFTVHGWGVLVEVLKHEMAHQYVDEVLGVREEPSHGPAFRRVCEERGFDARAQGVPTSGGSTTGDARVLDRIAKLLSLAQSPNQHEAQAAMSAAQRLMLRHNLESIASGGDGTYTFRHLGEPSGRVDESARLLAVILSEHFFVEVIWVPVWRARVGKRGSVLEVCGSVQNVELAEYVHAFLTRTAERLWREHRAQHGIRSQAGRRSFVAGVMHGFSQKLDREKKKSRSEGLVWVGDAELGRYFRKRHPHVRFQRYGSRAGSLAYSEGQKAGQGIVLHRGVRGERPRSTAPRLLPPGR